MAPKKTSLSEWILNPDGYLPKNDRSNAMALKQFKFYGKSNGLDLKSLERKLSNDLYNAWWNCCSIPILCSWNILILLNIHDIDADTYSSANRHSGVIIYICSLDVCRYHSISRLKGINHCSTYHSLKVMQNLLASIFSDLQLRSAPFSSGKGIDTTTGRLDRQRLPLKSVAGEQCKEFQKKLLRKLR